MSTDTDNVIAFPGVRVAAEPATLIIGAVLAEEPQVVHRQFGINDRLTLRECFPTRCASYSGSGESAPPSSPWTGPRESGPVRSAGRRARRRGVGAGLGLSVNVPLDTVIGDVLQDVGDTLTWHWGLWDHRLDVREAFARDEATPDALCIGGSGTIDGLWRGGRVVNVAAPGGVGRGGGRGGDAGAAAGDPRGGNAGNPGSAAGGPDIAAINELLTGEQSIRNTLATARDDVVDLIERSGVFEFVPLLQALDLRRNPGCAHRR